MEYKQAADILVKMSKQTKLTPAEKTALLIAVGLLSWTYLYKNRMKAIKAKREKNIIN